MAVPLQQTRSKLAADPITDVVPDNRAGGGGHNDTFDRQAAGLSGVDGGADQHRLARQWYARALQRHDKKDHPIAVGRNKMDDLSLIEHIFHGAASRFLLVVVER